MEGFAVADAGEDAGALWHHFNLVMSNQAALICCPADFRAHRTAIRASDEGAVGAFKKVAQGLGDRNLYDLADRVGRLMDRVDADELNAEAYAALGAEMAALADPLTAGAMRYSQSSDSNCRAPCGLGLPNCTR
jgi:hypothetical protein